MSQFDTSEPRVSSASSASSASRAQVRANRRNAKKSTGPRTDAGKRRAALNAATHGIFCKDAVLPGERTCDYLAFRNLLFNSPGLRPQTWLEMSLAEQYVLARWKIRRLLSTEALAHARIAEDLAEVASMGRAKLAEVLELRERYMTLKAENDRRENGDDDEEEEDEDEQDDEDARHEQRVDRTHELNQLFLMMHDQRRVPPATTLATSLSAAPGSEHAGVFERIDRLQHRLELSAHRALRELRQLRKDLGVDVSSLPDCPFLEEVVEEEEQDDRAREDVEDVVAQATTPRREAPEDEHHDHDDDDDDDDDDDVGRGVVTSVTTSCMSGPPNANAQNEPNSAKTRAGDDASEGCEQASRRIEPLEHTKLAPRGANPGRDDTKDTKETRDRT